jgi:hypothetical protein
VVFSSIHRQALAAKGMARRLRARAALLADVSRSLTVVGLYVAALTSALAGPSLALSASAIPLALATWAALAARGHRRRARMHDGRVEQLLATRRTGTAPGTPAPRPHAHGPVARMSPATLK